MYGNDGKNGFARLIQIAGTKKWWLIASMSLAVLGAIAQFIPFLSIFQILKELAAHAAEPVLIDRAYVWRWGYVALGAFFAYGILTYCSLMSSHIAAFNILYELRMSLARKLVRLPMGFFSKRASGEIKKVMAEDVERIELFVAHHIPDLTAALVTPLLILALLCATDWRLTLVVLAVFIAATAFMSRMMANPKMKSWTEKYLRVQGRMNGSLVEYVRGIQVVKVFNRSLNALERLNRSIDDYRAFAMGVAEQYATTYIGFYILLSSTMLFVLPAAVFFLLQSPSYPAYIPKVFLFLILGGGIFFPLLKLMWIGSLMNQNSMGVGLIDEILQKPEISDSSRTAASGDGSVVFDRVSFAYDTVPILKEISFAARPGAVTALVGPSGAGKTTVAMLAARYWDVTSGEIRVGGVPIRDLAVSDLMDRVAFVFQDNMLFFDSIEENIRMGRKSASWHDVDSASRAAHCQEFIARLDRGYDTLVGEGGTYLSGGEQQRIALARAILKDAPIILLDEATAFADPENEAKILASFSRLIKGKTVLVIAHRLSTITNADQILYIDQGVIAERGRHEELLARQGRYARMWETYSQSREWTIRTRS